MEMLKPCALRSRRVILSAAAACVGSRTINIIPRFSTTAIRSDARLLNSSVEMSKEDASPTR